MRIGEGVGSKLIGVVWMYVVLIVVAIMFTCSCSWR